MCVTLNYTYVIYKILYIIYITYIYIYIHIYEYVPQFKKNNRRINNL